MAVSFPVVSGGVSMVIVHLKTHQQASMPTIHDSQATPAPVMPCPRMHQRRASGPWNPAATVYTTAAVSAVGIGAAVLSMRKGTKTHRLLGRAWTGAMVTTCVTSFGVRDRTGGFSWIHGLSATTLSSIGAGIYHIRRKNVAKHKAFMGAAYVGALVAGALAVFGPRRSMNREVLSKSS